MTPYISREVQDIRRNFTFVLQLVIWGKVQYRIWNPHWISKSKRKKIIQIGPETTKLDCCGQDSHLEKVQVRISNPHQISKSKKKKKYSNRSINKEIGCLWSRQSFVESTMSDFESPSNSQVKEKKLFKSVQKQRNYA